ncbi:uncharacterized protein GIQ15_00254 [Arthroderma uncinatum]|uniref:uncharacterized protein n=1 Tax=Arthroderma uncinatum TaxID=74035 RepID=UPI00144AB90D|nr:uncharacterized protein GIQ15_00254 [Arthroderma uncinatum]KAF3490737.1 hypothetical protein GIQ15_00254 [Arthroderma uncinatum]
MTKIKAPKRPWGHSWRSSSIFNIVSIITALFAETFVHGFVVPILPYILEKRNNVDPADTQQLTYLVLSAYGAAAVASGPVIEQLTDRIKSRKIILVLGLGVALIGTATLATSTNGRTLQAVGSTTAQVVGHATLNDMIEPKNMGMVLGLVNTFISVGAFSGPAVAGFMLEYVGYWATWSTVLAVLVLDIVLKILMIEKPKKNNEPARVFDEESRVTSAQPEGENENSALLGGTPAKSYTSIKGVSDIQTGAMSMLSFYRIILTQPMVIIGLVSYMTRSSLMASFNTTLPTHVRDAFGWGSFPAGMMFVGLQAPAIVLNPLFGWIRNRTGNQLLSGVGFILLAPLLWLLGEVDQKWFPWSGSEDMTKVVYVVVIICIGCVQTLPASVGATEITSIIENLESQLPGIFGSGGGHSRGHALSNGSFNVGQLVGPLLSGVLADNLGYDRMNSTLCAICFVTSILAICFREKK